MKFFISVNLKEVCSVCRLFITSFCSVDTINSLSHSWFATTWQSGQRCTGIAEVKGSNPVQAWIFLAFLSKKSLSQDRKVMWVVSNPSFAGKQSLRLNSDDDRIVSHDAPRFMLYYHCVRDTLWSVTFSTREVNIDRSARCGWFPNMFRFSSFCFWDYRVG